MKVRLVDHGQGGEFHFIAGWSSEIVGLDSFQLQNMTQGPELVGVAEVKLDVTFGAERRQWNL